MMKTMTCPAALAMATLVIALLAGCGGGGDSVAPPMTQTTVEPTGLSVITDGATGEYVVYGGNYVPTDTGMDWNTNILSSYEMDCIRRRPAEYGYVLLGQGTGSANFSGGPYNYYLIKPLGTAEVAIDAFRLLGANTYWSGWRSATNGGGGFYAFAIDPMDALNGASDGNACAIAANADIAETGFIMLPGHSWD